MTDLTDGLYARDPDTELWHLLTRTGRDTDCQIPIQGPNWRIHRRLNLPATTLRGHCCPSCFRPDGEAMANGNGKH